VFAQVAVDLDQGAEWWLTPEEEAELEVQNDVHRVVSALEELILPALDLDMSKELWRNLSATEVLQSIGIERPTNPQCKECCSVFRRHCASPKKIQGIKKWKVPLKSTYTP
jgi:hypothetical protein